MTMRNDGENRREPVWTILIRPHGFAPVLSVDQVASHEGWLADPTLVTNFYNMLRRKLYAAQPNEGHRLIHVLEKEPLARVDYIEVVDFCNIQRTETITGEVLVAIAVYIGKTRLIDNFIWREE